MKFVKLIIKTRYMKNKLAKMQVAHGVERAMATHLHADQTQGR